MKDWLKAVDEAKYHGLEFFTNKQGNFEIIGFHYINEKIEKLPGSSAGDLYDIILYTNYPPELPERFKAILLHPVTYIGRLLEDGISGAVSLATKTSDVTMDRLYKKMYQSNSKAIELYNSMKEKHEKI